MKFAHHRQQCKEKMSYCEENIGMKGTGHAEEKKRAQEPEK